MEILHFDTTLRDGAQSEARGLSIGSKVEVANALAALGASTIEAGFAATKHDAEAIAEVSRIVGSATHMVEHTALSATGEIVVSAGVARTPIVTSLARANMADIDASWAAVENSARPGLHIVESVSDHLVAAKYPGRNWEQTIESIVRSIRYARSIIAPGTVLEFSAEGASQADPELLDQVTTVAIQAGANVINYPNTLGVSLPFNTQQMFARITKRVIAEGAHNDIVISCHEHNDNGMAVANSLAAATAVRSVGLDAGIKIDKFQIESTITGLGERVGNTAFEAVMINILLHGSSLGMNQNVDTRLSVETAQMVLAAFGREVPPKTAVVGSDANMHRSGIHSSAVAKFGASAYTAFRPSWVGHQDEGIIGSGPYQGRRGNDTIGSIDKY